MSFPDKSSIRGRLLAKRQITAIGCWENPSQRSPRYGHMSINNKSYSLHRLSLWAFSDFDLQSPLCVCHRCDNKRCFNPEHLFAATQQENIDDKIAKNRQTHGKQINTAKLSPEQVLVACERIAAGETLMQVAAALGVSFGLINQICLGRVWHRVTQLRPDLLAAASKRLAATKKGRRVCGG